MYINDSEDGDDDDDDAKNKLLNAQGKKENTILKFCWTFFLFFFNQK